ncbi:MAG TPA: flagellar hook capping FlgD N-terminal domain-containing protein [Bryobacteraceae bacterium]|nr:flagellar hook capping FlgD N-terminal domain-containing protein [Bryobacteraceae bacterium]
MASSVNPLGSTYTNTGATNTTNTNTNNSSDSTGLGGSVPSESVFLQLLVSQLQNQDPLNPTDSTTFVTQLAQFSQLEQTIGIKTDTDAIVANQQAAANAAATNTTSSNNTGTNSQTTIPTSNN